MPVGVVQFYIPQKGYGYIRVPESREEFYVSKRSIPPSINLQKGDWVRFEIKKDQQGLKAIILEKKEPNAPPTN